MSKKPTVKRLGILGGGQLGRMSAQAAQKLDIETVIYTDTENSPASQVAHKTYVGEYSNQDQLTLFAQDVDVISYEFENIPLDTIRFLSPLKPVCPDDRLLDIAQHRALEKYFLNQMGIPTPRWKTVRTPKEVKALFQEWDVKSLILKTCRFGYDGKGQIRLSRQDNIKTLFKSLGTDDVIAEEIVDFDYEISMIVARDVNGKSVFYGPLHNQHKNHILDITTSPPPSISEKLSHTAKRMVERLAEETNLHGVLTLELFVTKDETLLANEIAPRTHNSGHYSIDACDVSQFENHVRAVCGLEVKDPKQHTHATMINLIGDDVNDLSKYKEMNDAHIHLYGKSEVKAGRKMGHVTLLGEKMQS